MAGKLRSRMTATRKAGIALAGGLGIVIAAASGTAFASAGVLHPVTTRPALIAATAAGLAIWVLGENFGQILTGMGTDPNTGPLLILLAAAYWPLRERPDATAASGMPLAAVATARNRSGCRSA